MAQPKYLSESSGAFNAQIEITSERAKSLFSKSTSRAILRWCMYRTAFDWINNYLILRFHPSYARMLGYYLKGGKDRQPFFESGTMLDNTRNVTPKVVSRQGVHDAYVRFQIGHPMTPGIMDVFKRIPDRESKFLAGSFEEHFESFMSNRKKRVSKTGKMRLAKSRRKEIRAEVKNRKQLSTLDTSATLASIQARVQKNLSRSSELRLATIEHMELKSALRRAKQREANNKGRAVSRASPAESLGKVG